MIRESGGSRALIIGREVPTFARRAHNSAAGIPRHERACFLKLFIFRRLARQVPFPVIILTLAD